MTENVTNMLNQHEPKVGIQIKSILQTLNQNMLADLLRLKLVVLGMVGGEGIILKIIII